MARQLATHVWVQSDDGTGWFGPDDDLPEWAAKAITNPGCFVQDAASDDGPPPKGGPGSGKQAWVDYASAHNIEVPDSASKDDIITALESAEVPTERS
jgi:hypothetical protein